MSAEDDFTRLFGHLGRPWRLEDSDWVDAEAFQSIVDTLRAAIAMQRKSHGRKGLIYFDVIESEVFNAFATEVNGQEYIVLLTGLIGLIHSAFNCFFSDPEVLPGIGNGSTETRRSDVLEIVEGRWRPNPDDVFPIDEERKAFARNLALYSSIFVVLHEVGHVVRGHAAFLREHSSCVYEELPAIPTLGEGAELRRAFEWEADEYAAIAGYQLFRVVLDQLTVRSGLKFLDADRMWGISVTMVFVLMAVLRGGVLDQDTAVHPRPLFRFVWSMLSIHAASECEKFKPRQPSLQQGFTDVGEWLIRNGFSLQMMTSPEDAIDLLRTEHARVRSALRTHGEILDRLASARFAGSANAT